MRIPICVTSFRFSLILMLVLAWICPGGCDTGNPDIEKGPPKINTSFMATLPFASETLTMSAEQSLTDITADLQNDVSPPCIEPGQSFNFVAMGDSQKHPEIFEEILALATDDIKKTSFILHAGDAVDDGHDDAAWLTQFYIPAGNTLATIPIYSAMGNHEKSINHFLWYDDAARRNNFYSFVLGDAIFIFLDTNMDFGKGSAQHDWLINTVQSSEFTTSRWKFMVFHHPPFTEGWHNCNGYTGAEDVRKTLVPVIDTVAIDVVINGHMHGYERGIRHQTLYITTGGAGGDLDHYCQDIPEISKSLYEYNYVHFSLASDSLVVTAYNRNDEVIDYLILSKPTTGTYSLVRNFPRSSAVGSVMQLCSLGAPEPKSDVLRCEQ